MKSERTGSHPCGCGAIPRLIVMGALCLSAATLHADPGTPLSAEPVREQLLAGSSLQPGQDGRVAVTTAADGTRRYSIKAAPMREFSLRIGQSPLSGADACADMAAPR